ncbi:MAG: DUF2795 domain-containing protein [Actinomycetota bacterium]
MSEDPGDIQPIIEPDPVADGILTREEIEMRSAIARALERSLFPARRGEILEHARGRHVPDEIVGALVKLPEGEYDNVEDVWEALGGDVESRF